MATVVSVNEKHEGRSADLTFESSGTKSSYSRTFQVITDDIETDLRSLIRAEGIPRIGDEYPSDDSAAVKSVTPATTDNRCVYLVAVQYENPTRGSASGFTEDPAANEWTFSTSTTGLEQVAELDYGGHVQSAGQRNITNSAKEPFDPPLTEPYFVRVYTISKFLDTWDENIAIARVGKLNSAAINFLGVNMAKHCLRCDAWDTSGKQAFGGGEFYKITARFTYKEPYTVLSGGVALTVAGFVRAVVDQGFNELQAGKLIAISGAVNTLAKEPQLLDGAGLRLPDGVNYKPFYRLARTTQDANMSTWGLPGAT